ncbi:MULTISPECIES: hypothetical protein [unclassified Thioalkalivibrio]|uniref:hypothetical protein n=1 Tax=unclassified Thioalkalivibrio TaxID=2621013 RepID=UPI00036595DB|nr:MULTISPECIES: hypothetical protein [unclassified Thioalkalivibrio]
MHHYDNVPAVNWDNGQHATQAKMQVLKKEPVVLNMPDDMDWSVDDTTFRCRQDGEALMDCQGGELLRHLARQNDMPGLEQVAEACAESKSRVDLHPTSQRIVVHE